MGAAVEKFLRFYTSEYFEGSTERADLLLNDTTDKLTARRVNGEIERLSKQWSTGKRLRMASVFTSWAKYLGGVR